MEAVRAFFWLEALRLNRGKKHPARTVAFDLRLLTFFSRKGPKGSWQMTGVWERERGELRRKCGECECEDLIPRPLHSAFVHLHSAKLRHLCVKRQIRHFSSLHRSLSAETLHPLARPHSAHTEVYRCVYAATKTMPTSVQGELLYMCLKIETDTYQRMCSHSGSEEEDISVHSNHITAISRYISNTS